MSKIVISDFAGLQEYRGPCGPSDVEFVMGELALDVIGSTTSEELLVALRGLLDETDCKAVVGVLLKNGLLFDTIIDEEVR
jgi:hypothetical protein